MKIEIGKYTVHGDSFCVWIMEGVPYINKKGEHAIKQDKVGGYSPHFEQLLSSFVRQKGISSKAKTVKAQLEEFAQIEKDMLVIAEALGAKLDTKKGR